MNTAPCCKGFALTGPATWYIAHIACSSRRRSTCSSPCCRFTAGRARLASPHSQASPTASRIESPAAAAAAAPLPAALAAPPLLEKSAQEASLLHDRPRSLEALDSTRVMVRSSPNWVSRSGSGPASDSLLEADRRRKSCQPCSHRVQLKAGWRENALKLQQGPGPNEALGPAHIGTLGPPPLGASVRYQRTQLCGTPVRNSGT